MRDAVAALVRDGDVVVIEGFTHLICFAAGHEIIRQRRRDLTLCRLTPDLIYDQMIAAGCARKLVFSWAGNPGAGSLHAFRRAVEWSRDPRGWIVFTGGNGCGKTHLAAAIANERLEQGERVAFANVPDLLDQLRSAYAPDAAQSYDQLFASLVEVPLLILDDLGAQKSSPWAMRLVAR